MLKVEQDKSQIKLSGQLNFDTVAQLLGGKQVDFKIMDAENGPIEVDLSDISRFNSASLALLIEWMKMSQQKGLQIKYHNAPEQLMAIARAYGIDHELPMHE